MNSTTAVENLPERVRACCGESLQVTSVAEAEQFAVAVARQVGQAEIEMEGKPLRAQKEAPSRQRRDAALGPQAGDSRVL
jgi:hypothetical protein